MSKGRLDESESEDSELEIDHRATGECITKVKICKATNYEINHMQLEDNSNQLIDQRIESSSAYAKHKLVNRPILIEQEDEEAVNNRQVNGCDRTDKIEQFAIVQMSTTNPTNGAWIDEQANCKTSCKYLNAGRSCSNNNKSEQRSKNATSEHLEELLEELAAFNGGYVRSKSRLNVARNEEKQASNEEWRRSVERRSTNTKGGGPLKRSQVDGEQNLGASALQQTAGKLKGTVQVEAFKEHLDANAFDQYLNSDLCSSSHRNHVDLVSSADQSDYTSALCSDLFACLDHVDLVGQTNDFVTIIQLDFNTASDHDRSPLDQLDTNCDLLLCDQPLCDQPLCDDLCVNRTAFESNDFNSISMYAISGVPNGLTNKSQTLIPNGSSMPKHPLIPHRPASSPSVVPVVVSSTSSVPAILHHPSAQSSLQNVHFITEKVQIFRQRGERIGLALSFNEASTQSDQNIERVFIQNVNPNSPASDAKGDRLGSLRENDELLCIENRPVNTMTRLDCVECLRDAGTCITLLVRGARVDSSLTRTAITFENQPAHHHSTDTLKRASLAKRSPPVIPPRMSTTVLTSVQINKLGADSALASKNCEMSNHQSTTANNHPFKNSSSVGTLMTMKVPRSTGLRRPVVAPPLPPRKLSSSSNEDADNRQSDEHSSKSTEELCSLSKSSELINGTSSDETIDADSVPNALDNDSTSLRTVNKITKGIVSDDDSHSENSNCSDDRSPSSAEPLNGLESNQIERISETGLIEQQQQVNSIDKAPKSLGCIVSSNAMNGCLSVSGESTKTVNITKTDPTDPNDQSDQRNDEHSDVFSVMNNINQLNSISSTPIQHQSTKQPSVSYAANIATSTFQLINGLSNCINSPSSQSAVASNQLDLLTQNVCMQYDCYSFFFIF